MVGGHYSANGQGGFQYDMTQHTWTFLNAPVSSATYLMGMDEGKARTELFPGLYSMAPSGERSSTQAARKPWSSAWRETGSSAMQNLGPTRNEGLSRTTRTSQSLTTRPPSLRQGLKHFWEFLR